MKKLDDLVGLADGVNRITGTSGGDGMRCCPMPGHDDGTPSFSITGQLFKCHGCGASGKGLLSFYIQYAHGNNKAAAGQARRELVKMGLLAPGRKSKKSQPVRDAVPPPVDDMPPPDMPPVDDTPPDIPPAHNQGLQQQPAAPLPNDYGPAEVISKAADRFSAALAKSTAAQDYLNGRGVNKQGMADFRLGFAPAMRTDQYIDGLGGHKDVLLSTGLLRQYKGRLLPAFSERVIFPVMESDGSIASFIGRLTRPVEKQKYIFSTGFKKADHVYGAAQAVAYLRGDSNAPLYIVEGSLDAVLLHQQGYAAVAIMGADASEKQLHWISSAAVRPVFCLDGDKAGRAGAAKAVYKILPYLTDQHRPAFINMPDGVDAADAVNDGVIDDLVRESIELQDMLAQPVLQAEAAARESVAMAAAAELEKIANAAKLQQQLYDHLAAAAGMAAARLRGGPKIPYSPFLPNEEINHD